MSSGSSWYELKMHALRNLAPAKRKSLKVAETLIEQLRAGRIGIGGKLPSERELSDSFTVSRTVVREALNSLQMAGVIDRRAGDGTYVAAHVDTTQLELHPIAKQLDAGVIIMEANEAREALDLAVTKLALDNARPSDITTMQTVVKEMRAALEQQDLRRYLELTLRLHIAIARASGNSVLERLVVELVGLVRPHIWLIMRNYTLDVARESFRIHEDMAEGIRLQDRDRAIDAVTRHYHEYPSLQG
jgi:GntR family transcriptional repressor for pyruvate dehydrogenase complex